MAAGARACMSSGVSCQDVQCAALLSSRAGSGAQALQTAEPAGRRKIVGGKILVSARPDNGHVCAAGVIGCEVRRQNAQPIVCAGTAQLWSSSQCVCDGAGVRRNHRAQRENPASAPSSPEGSTSCRPTPAHAGSLPRAAKSAVFGGSAPAAFQMWGS